MLQYMYDNLFLVGLGLTVSTTLAYKYAPHLALHAVKTGIATYVDLKHWLYPTKHTDSPSQSQSQQSLNIDLVNRNNRFTIYRVNDRTYITFDQVPVHDKLHLDEVEDIIIVPDTVDAPAELHIVIHQLSGHYGDFHNCVPFLDDVRHVYPQLDTDIEKIIINTRNMEEYVIT